MKVSLYTPPSHTFTLVMKPWMKEVETATGGQVQFTLYDSSILGPSAGQYDLVTKGVADITIVPPSFSPNRFPLNDVVDLPFVGMGTPTQNVPIQMALYQKYLNTEIKDAKFLGTFVTNLTQLTTAKKQVMTLEDIKGLRIRANGLATQMTTLLGASPVGMGPGDIYDAMSKGVLDGSLFPIEGAVSYKLQEVTKYCTVIDMFVTPFIIVMNSNTWAGLPVDVQKVIDQKAGADLSMRIATAWEAEEKRCWQVYKDAGVVFYTLPATEKQRWVDATKPMNDKWVADMEAKGLPGKAVYNELGTLVKK